MCQCYGNEVYDSATDYEGNNNNVDQGNDAASSNGQSASRRNNIWQYIVAGSGVALLIGALIMRKRVSQSKKMLAM